MSTTQATEIFVTAGTLQKGETLDQAEARLTSRAMEIARTAGCPLGVMFFMGQPSITLGGYGKKAAFRTQVGCCFIDLEAGKCVRLVTQKVKDTHSGLAEPFDIQVIVSEVQENWF